MIEGGCQCGAVRYRVAGEPLYMIYCHCSQCRRANGSTVATNIGARTRDFTLTRGADALRSWASSPGNLRHFCSRCGSPIYGEIASRPELRSIRAGTVDGDPGVRPSAHVHAGFRAPWDELRDDLPEYEDSPG